MNSFIVLSAGTVLIVFLQQSVFEVFVWKLKQFPLQWEKLGAPVSYFELLIPGSNIKNSISRHKLMYKLLTMETDEFNGTAMKKIVVLYRLISLIGFATIPVFFIVLIAMNIDFGW